MSRTGNKLAEARYFLDRMNQEATTFANHDGAALTRLLFSISGFVTAARSVTFVLKKEFSAHPEFSRRYAPIERYLRGDAMAESFLRLRNVMQKEGNSWPRISLNFNLPNANVHRIEIDLSGSRGNIVTKQNVTPAPENMPELDLNSDPSEFADVFIEALDKVLPTAPEELTWSNMFDWDIVMAQGAKPLPSQGFLIQCELYLDQLKKVVLNAEREFLTQDLIRVER